MHNLLNDAAQRALRYLDELDARSVAPSAEAVQGLSRFHEPLPELSTDPREVLALLDQIGSPATVSTAGRRFFGFVTGGVLPATLAANWLAAAWDQNASMVVLSPVGAALEDVVLGWLRQLFRLPPGSGGALVTGGTMANFTSIAAARHALLAAVGWDVEAQGLFGAPPITVVVGEEVHVSMLKALGLAGLGRERVVRVPADAQGRMRADKLPKLAGPTLICTQAGNVNSGAFDPIGEICARAHEAGAWVHVDGAFGLWAAVARERKHLVEGVELADSWATDCHKWLNVPHDSGIALVRDEQHLLGAIRATAAYLVHGEQREPHHHTPEASRRARGIEVWAALRSLGRSGLEDMIERTCRHAERFAQGLRAAGYEILNDVVLNQVLVSFGDDETTRRVIAAIQQDGTCWCGGTVWHGRAVMRISVSSWATRDEDVDRSLAAMIGCARSLGVVKNNS